MITLKKALTQVKKLEELQSNAFKEKRRKQRNGLIRSGHYENKRPS